MGGQVLACQPRHLEFHGWLLVSSQHLGGLSFCLLVILGTKFGSSWVFQLYPLGSPPDPLNFSLTNFRYTPSSICFSQLPLLIFCFWEVFCFLWVVTSVPSLNHLCSISVYATTGLTCQAWHGESYLGTITSYSLFCFAPLSNHQIARGQIPLYLVHYFSNSFYYYY